MMEPCAKTIFREIACFRVSSRPVCEPEGFKAHSAPGREPALAARPGIPKDSAFFRYCFDSSQARQTVRWRRFRGLEFAPEKRAQHAQPGRAPPVFSCPPMHLGQALNSARAKTAKIPRVPKPETPPKETSPRQTVIIHKDSCKSLICNTFQEPAVSGPP